MKSIYLVFLILITFNFSGCSLKDIKQPNEIVHSQEDSLLSEFENELKVEEIYDPFGGYNRIMTSFNDGVYEYFLKPVSKGYKAVVHEEIRISVGNFFNNIYFPQRFVNNLLQGKFKNASEETGRFVINTTVGLLGLFDPAKSYFNLVEHKEDFGQTLGFYGVGSGPHIVLPLLGPSNLRDALSLYPDSLLSPVDYEDRSYWTLTDTWLEYTAVRTYEYVNANSLDIERYEEMKKDAVDLYPFLRDIYEQYRENQIKE
ncbi:MlaA family lipoprotein [Candidatus Sulfurimonas baltica]|uniref:VacJ family lipoprotein n=1 Tax=Candidatus Sulfurimonas baltica TaxID=2740404 RepID=A0A7S7LWZ6_9BACT|nr:VacJ family lipoprotein [Candidatus Sulfurimonas baltica]QOY52882.1 VacJ family lipoprotein [Candidatus Sulfurimonas baltica]